MIVVQLLIPNQQNGKMIKLYHPDNFLSNHTHKFRTNALYSRQFLSAKFSSVIVE